MNQDEIEFQIKRIDILEFSFRDPRRFIPENSPFRFDIQIIHHVNLKEENIFVNSQYNIYYDNDEDPLGKAAISCVYHIVNIQQFVNESGKFALPEHLITMFNSISISTCRGVLFTLFRGTPLHSVILPIVNPQQVFN